MRGYTSTPAAESLLIRRGIALNEIDNQRIQHRPDRYDALHVYVGYHHNGYNSNHRSITGFQLTIGDIDFYERGYYAHIHEPSSLSI